MTILEYTTRGQQRIAVVQSATEWDLYVIGHLHPWTEYVFAVAIDGGSNSTNLISKCPEVECVTEEAGMSKSVKCAINFSARHFGIKSVLSAIIMT